jgi:hypothetical protein
LEGFGSDRWTPIDLGIRKLFHSIPDRYAGSIFSESRPSILGRSQGKKKCAHRARLGTEDGCHPAIARPRLIAHDTPAPLAFSPRFGIFRSGLVHAEEEKNWNKIIARGVWPHMKGNSKKRNSLQDEEKFGAGWICFSRRLSS